MKSISEIMLDHMEETTEKFYKDCGKRKDGKKDKRQFINWYIENHSAPLTVLIHDLSEYYLHISEDRILRMLNDRK